jgi:transcriptional regulator with XRE-family HTH domain
MKAILSAESHPPDEVSRRRDNKAAARALSRELIRLRSLKGLTQAGLARASGVSRSTINALESGQGEDVYVRTVKLLAAALNVTPDALLGYADIGPRLVMGRKSEAGDLTLGFGPGLSRR